MTQDNMTSVEMAEMLREVKAERDNWKEEADDRADDKRPEGTLRR